MKYFGEPSDREMFKIKDRVKESSITEGSHLKVVLNDTYGGFESFLNAIGDGNSTFYTIENNDDYEIGIGTYYSSDNSISRDIILESSNNGDRITLLGVSVVFGTYPGTHAFFVNDQGFASGQAPYYSGIAFPDGRIQNVAYQGSGEAGHITFWNGTHSFDSNHYLFWDNPTSTLFVSGVARFDSDVYIGGNFEVAGTQTIVNTEINNSIASGTTFTQSTFIIDDAAGCFFHAYVDNDYDKIVALYSTNEPRPIWKLGLKDYSSSFTSPPVRGYVFGDKDSIGGIASNESNLYVMNSSNGFWVRHVGRDLFNVDRNGGLNVYNDSPVAIPFSIRGAAGQSVNLQEWKNYSSSLVASLDRDGNFSCNCIEFSDGTVQCTANTSSESKKNHRSLNSSGNILTTDDVIIASAILSDITLTLPSASQMDGKTIIIKFKKGPYTCTIFTVNNETIDEDSSFIFRHEKESISLFSDSVEWHIV